MSRQTKTLATLALSALAALAALAPAASAAPGPAWQISLQSQPTNFAPGAEAHGSGGVGGYPLYSVWAENVGGAAPSGATTIVVQLPSGVTPAAGSQPFGKDQVANEASCAVSGQTVTCTDPEPIDPGKYFKAMVPVDVESLPDPTLLEPAVATIAGGGASATARTATTVSGANPPFGLLPGGEGLNASTTAADGAAAASQAGSHPQQLNLNFSLPTQYRGSFPIRNGTLHDARVDLPAGLVVDPSAVPACSMAQFVANGCPEASQVGTASIATAGSVEISTAIAPIYNLSPPPGHAAQLGFIDTYSPVPILGDVRPGAYPGSYRITSLTPSALAALAVFDVRIQLWGSPSDASHDRARGSCRSYGASGFPLECPVARADKPFLTLPTSCTETMQAEAAIDLWEQIGRFYDRSAELADGNGVTTPVTGCSALAGGFGPSLGARPTTSQADSPSGLSVDLRIPQTDSVGLKATPQLRKAVVALPQGMALNPSSANGLEACSSSQVGIDPGSGIPNDNPVACPDASRIGSVEVDTPLLDHTLPGSVYVATPYDNPFDSLLAIYVTVDDPVSGTLIKLAGHVVPDPSTGQLVTTFDENPQLPFSDFKLSFFGGPGAVLRTPAVCGTYSTTSTMTPWSAPESGPPATPSDSWSISGSCSSSEAAMPNEPEFEAGTVSPIAGKYTPFVTHLRREDGSQQFSKLTVTPPPGLVGKLAGIPYCSDAALAAAAGRSGSEEKAHPDCGDASRIGTVHVAAGAGPAPYWTQGTAYLAGPYKGAPLSMAIVTPATAGPYDLGTVVTRVALHIDPVTTQITADADPIPHILKGIPLDVRAVNVSLDRSNFTRTGTSCEPMSIGGNLISTFGQGVGLESRYQLGNCANLAFKPKLFTRLFGKTKRTGFPAFRAVYMAKEGEANLKGLVLRFPRSEFIEQGHFRTICTRVQFAAAGGNGAGCPGNSVYGHIRVFTPLLDNPLEGPVFLRSSSHNLPDVVFALHGQIDAEVATRIDSVKGGLRASLEGAPDVPVSKAILLMRGGQKGLFVNSRDICAHTYRATANIEAQSGAAEKLTPALKNGKCRKATHKKHRRHHRDHKRAHRRSHR